MKTKVFWGVGAVFAALTFSASADAQDANTQTINQNIRTESIQRNEGLPSNPRIPHQTPSLGLGNIYGLNPCATGVSVGVTTPLVGIGGAFSNIDSECQTRNNAAVLVSGLRDEAAAREVLCSIPVIRQAFIRIRRPCIEDGGAAVILPSNYPAGAGQAGQYNAETLPPPNLPIPPSVVPRGGTIDGDPRLRSEAPAFCRISGLDPSLYPECRKDVATTAANRTPQAARPQVRKQPRDIVQPQASPPRFYGGTLSMGEGCAEVSDIVRRFYPDCNPRLVATASR